MPENCVVKHCIVGREKFRKSGVYGRCQGKLASQDSVPFRSLQKMKVVLTPSMYAMSKRRVPTPTWMSGLMLLTSPGKVSGTETIIATAARQFCEIYK